MIENAFKHRQSDLQVQGAGVVIKILSDDNYGSRHQRFVLRLDSGHTLLIAHNIDVEPRLEPLHLNDKVAFCGEYEWTEKGGVLHWTHPDPSGTHPDGWVRKD